jgi:hypothetical protein
MRIGLMALLGQKDVKTGSPDERLYPEAEEINSDNYPPTI